MAFVKLDTGILDSTLWMDREARECFVTALLMAVPQEFEAPIQQIEVRSLSHTDFAAPAGWYGFVPAAGIAIVRRAGIAEIERGFAALERLGAPEVESRSPEFDGRRLIRIDGGYLVLNYMKYRDRDYTGAERARRYRERHKEIASRRDVPSSRRDGTVTSRMQSAEAEVEAEKSKRVPTEPVGPKPDDPVAQVFDHWRTVHKHPHAQLDEKRRKLIQRALKHYSEADLCRAITGYRNSPHHMGQNDRATVYDDIELLLRDSKHIDAGLKFHDEPPRTGLSPLTRRNVDAVADWVPPEMRSATG